MERADISQLLIGALSPECFQEAYAQEVAAHRKILEKRGASATVILTGDQSIRVDKAGFRGLLDSSLAGTIRAEMFAYLLDALTLDPMTEFAEEETRDLAMDLAAAEPDREGIHAALLRLSERD